MPVLPTTPAVRNATSKASLCVGKRIQKHINPRFGARRRAVTSYTKAEHAVQDEEKTAETRCGSNSLRINHLRLRLAPNPLLHVGSVSSLNFDRPLPNKHVLANAFSTAAPGDALDGPIDIQQLEADTDAALQGGECNLLELLDCWTHWHESQRTGLLKSEWSDPGSQRLRRVVECAERVDALVRSYHDGTLNVTVGSGLVDELEPYRVSMRVWSLTPVYYSGDRAAAVLELWGDKYGGDMTKQPTIEAFDVVLKAYALSSGVHVNDGDFDEEEASSIEYPDDKAVSTLRLLNNLGDMYLAPTVTTVSYVIQALRRASRTPRGYNDCKNEKRTRTAISLLREIEGDVATLFHDISSDLDDGAKLRQQRYVQALCDALTMSVTSLPLNEAIDKSQFFLDEIDRCAFQNSELIPSLASVENKRDPETSQTIYLLRNMIQYTLKVYRNRATYDKNEAEYSHNSAKHILTIARSAIDVFTQARRWAGILLPRNYVTFEQICSLAADSNVAHDASVDVGRDIVPIIFSAEEMLWEAKGDLPIESFRRLISSWANLSGHVANVVGHDGHAASPAERVTKMMKHRRELNSLYHPDPEDMVDLTGDYNCTLQAWSKARAGKLGAVKGLELFDEMRSDTINATPNEVTYGLILKCLRYSNSPSMAMKAESIISEMHERYENEEEGPVRPNARHYGAAIASLATKTLPNQARHY